MPSISPPRIPVSVPSTNHPCSEAGYGPDFRRASIALTAGIFGGGFFLAFALVRLMMSRSASAAALANGLPGIRPRRCEPERDGDDPLPGVPPDDRRRPVRRRLGDRGDPAPPANEPD